MRRYQKQSILELLDTLEEAHAVAAKSQAEAACDMLAECQQTAIELGAVIDELEGEGSPVIPMLEAYCEELYQVSLDISQAAESRLNASLAIVRGGIAEHIPERTEVLFLPYKASMWDSMESIFLAAKDDPRCDVYVMPIPYYDRKPDRNLGAMHYEGADFPDGVTVTHYSQYDIAERQPDIIYIHNPYDGGNLVTTVDGRYYSSELRKYTGCLVYVPYFVVEHDLPSHFANAAACLNADWIIAQSEQVCADYRRFSAAAADKFLPLGSPKYDAVINKRYSADDLPDGWAERLGGRKVVLYNTSLGAILSGDRQYLTKLRSVLEFFREHSEAALWWRPHPLSGSTYSAMRNELLDEYRQLVEDYKAAGFGIYDDTPDLHRAIAMSDMYYGDKSSLISMYQLTGKPVLVQSAGITRYGALADRISLEDVYDDGGSIWFSAADHNGLYRMKHGEEKPQLVCRFPNEPMNGQRLYAKLVHSGGRLFFVPLYANEIAVYDLASGGMTKIPFRRANACSGSFIEALEMDGRIYLIPWKLGELVSLGTQDFSLAYHGFPDKRLASLIFRGCGVLDGMLYMSSYSAGVLAAFDLKTGKISTVSFDGVEGFQSVCVADNRLFLLDNAGRMLLEYQPKNRSVTLHELPEEACCAAAFIDMCHIGGRLYLLPFYGEGAYEYSIADRSFSRIEALDAAEQLTAMRYFCASASHGRIFAYSLAEGRLLCYEPDGTVTRSDLRSEDAPEQLAGLLHRFDDACADALSTDLYENPWGSFDLVAAVQGLTSLTDGGAAAKRAALRKQTIASPDGTAGEKIHNFMMTEVTK